MAGSGSIPREVLDFIDTSIDSVDQLEILLLLRRHRDRTWTAREIGAELRNNEAVVAQRLAFMHAMGLLQCEGQLNYRYGPADARRDRVVSLLANAHPDYRFRIIERIYTKGNRRNALPLTFDHLKRG